MVGILHIARKSLVANAICVKEFPGDGSNRTNGVPDANESVWYSAPLASLLQIGADSALLHFDFWMVSTIFEVEKFLRKGIQFLSR